MCSSWVRFLCAGALAASSYLCAQSVVSVHSGVVHFLEGSVSIDGLPLTPKFGKFYDIQPGSKLETDRGRAEILLTPGVILRVDDNSSIRMVSNRLNGTRVEFVGGSAALDSRDAPPDPTLVLSFKTYQIRFHKPGRYRLNSVPAELQVMEGSAEIAMNGKSAQVSSGRSVSLTPALVSKLVPAAREDDFDRWVEDRSQTLTAGNTAAVASDDLSDAVDSGSDPSYDASAGGGYLPPGDLWVGNLGFAPWGLYNPISPYPQNVQAMLFIPMYRRSVGLSGYRSLSLIGGHLYTPPTYGLRAPIRVAPPPYRRSIVVGRPAIHAGRR